MANRRRVLKTTLAPDLILLAGLPGTVAKAAGTWITDRLPGVPKVITMPASSRDGSIYSQQYIESLVRAATEYAERQAEVAANRPNRVSLLRSSYRFGVPLPPGFHHDAQFAGRSLYKTSFECAENGPITLSTTHANIYPDDVIRT